MKPFGVVALIEAGGIDAFDLEPAEIAIMASSHSGEDLHVRTIQAMFRRAGVSQTLIATGIEGMPLDKITAMRLARDGEQPGPIRHMCSGQHAVRSSCHGSAAGTRPTTGARTIRPRRLPRGGRPGVRDDARQAPHGDRRLRRPDLRLPAARGRQAYAMLADPSAVPRATHAASLAEPLTIVRDAMLAHPEMVGGTRDRLDTSLMKAMPGRS